MRCIAALLTLLFLCVTCVSAQTPTASPTPPQADTDDVVKITTALIQLDVSVTDKKGNVITDLRPDEIEIYENGEKQKLTRFSFVSNMRSTEARTATKVEKGRVLPPPTAVRPEQVRRTVALVVDDLALSFRSTYSVRQTLRKFVDEQMRDGDLVAIIRTGGGIGALQQFTTDKRQLYAAIEKVRFNLAGLGKIGAFAPMGESLPGREATEDPEQESSEERAAEIESERQSLFAVGTLGAVDFVVRGMRDLPGRKSIILLSDGFRLFTRDSAGVADGSRVFDNLRRLVDTANRAAVVIYAIDARGLVSIGLTAEDNTGTRSFTEIDEALAERRTELFDTQDGMRFLARQTGGFAVLNSNDLNWGVERVLNDQSYYLLGYEPDDATFDPKVRRFNRLEIKVTRPGTHVRYRSGFFGVSDERIAQSRQSTTTRLGYALTSPFAVNDIAVRLNTLFYDAPRHGSVLRSLLHVRAQDLQFTIEANGDRKAVFDIVAMSFGDNGVVVDQKSGTYTITLPEKKFAEFVKRGFVYDFAFPVKKAGAYQLRVALRDHKSDKLGSANQFVEIPNLKKNRVVLSGIVLENIELAEWENRNAGKPPTEAASGALMDTSLRQFRRGTVLNYGFFVYNAKTGQQGHDLTYQTRIYRDGRPVFEGSKHPMGAKAGENGALNFSASLALLNKMTPGDYVLQIVVTDNLAKAKHNTTVQFVQFEIVE